MKGLPEIRLNGNLGAWVMFFGFLGSVIAVSVTAGLWIGGVNNTTYTVGPMKKNVDSLSVHVEKLGIQVEGLATTVNALTGAVADMSQGIDNVSGQVSGVRSATDRIRNDMASRSWVLSLKNQTDDDHRMFTQGLRDLQSNTDKLESVEGELRDRVNKLESLSKKIREKKQ